MRLKSALGLFFLFSLTAAVLCFVQYLGNQESATMGQKKQNADHLAQGQQLLQAGKYDLAIVEFRQCKPDNPQAILGIAECSYWLGDDAGCINQVVAIRRMHATECYGRALLLRGLVRKRAGDIKQAKECFHAAVVAGEAIAQNELDALGG